MHHASRITHHASLVYFGLGSNLGDRAANLQEAVRRLRQVPGCRLERVSPLYETEPVGPVPQGWFLNAVALGGVELAPLDLLHAVKGVEQEMGRTPGVRWGPRVIDIDLLIYGKERISSDELVVPHPELWNRVFVLAPLRDVLPPGDLAERVARRLEDLGPSPVVRLYQPLGRSHPARLGGSAWPAASLPRR